MSLSSTSKALGRAPSRAISSALRAATRPNNLGRAVATRAYSTGSQGSKTGSGKAPLWGLAAFNIGLGGYWLASQQNSSTDRTSPQYGTTQDFERAIAELKATLGEAKVSTDADDLHGHGFSAFDHHPKMLHTVIVYPQSTEEVSKLVKIANKFRMPVVPYSGGTSLEGQYRGSSVGGICVDMSNMDQVLEIHESDSDLVCQAGARWMDINEMLKDRGIPLFFPLDPAPGATIGGMASTGCSGTNAVRYGTAKGEWFLNLTVVLPSGEIIKTRQRSRKSSAGFDVTKIFIGAEGTLGIITEATIRLTPRLPTNVAVVQFPSVKHATEAVVEVMNKGVGIQCVELVDEVYMKATNKLGMSKRKWPEKDSLFFKLQGPTPASLAESGKIVQEVVTKYGGSNFQLARNEEEAEQLWSDRKNAHFVSLTLYPGATGWPTDVCVPVSKLPELVAGTQKDLQERGLTSSVIGHVGDGNFHAMILFKTEEERKLAKEAVSLMIDRAIALEGTCTGEHGVGIGKKDYLVKELGLGTVELMKTIKHAVDPLGLFNPGKLYPDTPSKRR